VHCAVLSVSVMSFRFSPYGVSSDGLKAISIKMNFCEGFGLIHAFLVPFKGPNGFASCNKPLAATIAAENFPNCSTVVLGTWLGWRSLPPFLPFFTFSLTLSLISHSVSKHLKNSAATYQEQIRGTALVLFRLRI